MGPVGPDQSVGPVVWDAPEGTTAPELDPPGILPDHVGSCIGQYASPMGRVVLWN